MTLHSSGNEADSTFFQVISAPPDRRWWARVVALGFSVALLYFLPGTLGHDPWKQDETYSFGIVKTFMDGGDWVVPTNAGQPFLEKPPLYYWSAALLARSLDRVLPPHDGARLTSALFSSVTFVTLIIWAWARETRRRALAAGTPAASSRKMAVATSAAAVRALAAVVLFGGSPLIVKHLHDLFTDVALIAGTVCALYGLYRTVARIADAGRANWSDIVLFGIGTGVAQMTKGFFVPAVLAATALATPLLVARCRTRATMGAYASALLAVFVVTLPFVAIWPAFLYQRSPQLFMTWFWDNNVGRFIGFSVDHLGSVNEQQVVLRALLVAAFPAGPLAVAALLGGGWRRGVELETAVPLVFCIVGLALLACSATARASYLLPFIAPLALLAADGLDTLCRRAMSLWHGFSTVVFSAAAALVWFEWIVMMRPPEHHSASRWLAKWLPLDYRVPFSGRACAFAVTLTLTWLLVCWIGLRRNRTNAAGVADARDTVNAALRDAGMPFAPFAWFAGVTATWGLVFTLLVPWLDYAKSYRSVFQQLASSIAAAYLDQDCMSSINVGESEAPMLEYFGHIVPVPVSDPAQAARRCRWLLVMDAHSSKNVPGAPWQTVWQGARPGDPHERLTLYRRQE
jgi:4-amino-4-deoxy-L-arabinose transferase-like glycosyltransferase